MIDKIKTLIKKTGFILFITQLFNFTVPVRMMGSNWYFIPVINNLGLLNLVIREFWLANLTSILLQKKGGCFIDVGVNIDQSLLSVKSVDPDLQYYGFEPNPNCVFYLGKLIKKNGLKNVQIVPVGLSEKSGVVDFFSRHESASAATIIKDLRPAQQPNFHRSLVPVFNFDQLAESGNFEGAGIIKVDVEGAELKVLRGMKKYLSKYKPMIICEVLHTDRSGSLEMSKQSNTNLKELFSSLGYQIYRIIKTKNKRNVRRLEKIYEFGNEYFHKNSPDLCDYLFVSNENVQSILNFFPEK